MATRKKRTKQEMNEILLKIESLSEKMNRKYKISRAFFITLNLINIFISAAIIVLNLYSIRFNTYAKETMIFFVIIAFLSTFITFIISIKTFINFSDKSGKLQQNVDKNSELLQLIQAKNTISEEDAENIMQTL
ncbi:hypothetical protein [Mycoplasmopsis iners]|uniref:hypothetical protein n=1 Tax=Mycoplasmopsis iners TaxID=76630 RepID=UPI000B143E2E|nr:hypothetical protein [Mycoplasmopsis iners]